MNCSSLSYSFIHSFNGHMSKFIHNPLIDLAKRYSERIGKKKVSQTESIIHNMQTQPSLKRSTLRLFYLSLLLDPFIVARCQTTKAQDASKPQRLTHQ